MNEPLVLAIVTVISAATPLLLAALGELVVERSGVGRVQHACCV